MRATAAGASPTAPPAFSLPDALLDPTAYPDRPASIELRETHISWVFLAGETAYKVKKPVRLDPRQGRPPARGSPGDRGQQLTGAAADERRRGPLETPAPPLARLDTRQPTATLLTRLAAALDVRLTASEA